MDFELEKAISVLETSPSVLRAWLEALPEEWVRSSEGGDSWSPFDVVGHLIHGEKTDWIPRAEIILSEEKIRRFESFDRFAMFSESEGKTIRELLDVFAQLRQSSIARLWELQISDVDLKKTGIHPSLGEVTLRQLLATWVAHDLNHLGQVAEVMARQYRLEVGPWSEMLDILGE
jgi:uncharacterized damage-inducible protein DinB